MRLTVDNIRVSLGGRLVVNGVSLSIEPGRVVGLLGPNGAGKSTLMRALAGQVAASGTMTLGPHDLTGAFCSQVESPDVRINAEKQRDRPVQRFYETLHRSRIGPAERARLIAYLPQARAIGWRLKVRDLVALGRLPWRSFGSRASAEDHAVVDRAMALMDVTALADRIATELSGGEQARVLAARAVAQHTPLLIADEPASGLDPAHQITMMQALRRLAGDGRTVLVSLHDLTLAARWCDEIVMLKEGTLAAAGTPETVLTDERLAEIYGVRAHRARDAKGLILAPVDLIGASDQP
ncbi:ABC transporter ATP-binding protein [Nitratireductor soli]|uniref:ABC transporter ATP-binding protein n=1 Tax=Nitratireductor soli TaxID=1670619 RepID=UPI00065DDACA|nr:ABC transporter ATP-binding protein [Nitratireductor soli]